MNGIRAMLNVSVNGVDDQLSQAHRHHVAGELAEAEGLYQAVLARQPNHAEAMHLLGLLWTQKGKLAAGIELMARSVALEPAVLAYINLGNALLVSGNPKGAEKAYGLALELEPDNAGVLANLGLLMQREGEYDEAIYLLRQALGAIPGVGVGGDGHTGGSVGGMPLASVGAVAANNLGSALLQCGFVNEAVEAHRLAVAYSPHSGELHSNLLFALNFVVGMAPEEVFQEHRRWNDLHAKGLATIERPALSKSRVGPIRVGYLSPDFCSHAVARFFEPVFAGHSAAVETFCYYSGSQSDATTARIRQLAGHWREVAALSDQAAAEMIRADGLDILVDLAGHTAGNRLGVMARRPAAVQMTYLGYANTSGLDVIDYRITDGIVDPIGLTEGLNVEKLLRLPGCFLCYQPEMPVPAVEGYGETRGENREKERRGIVFGSFNGLARINEEVALCWASILRQVDGSKLILKAPALGSGAAKERLLRLFAKGGVAEDRIEFLFQRISSFEHMQLYGRMDIALDTFPVNGTTTTCDALYMGIPVISLYGNTHASRVGLSLLNRVGMRELAAGSMDEYCRIAVGLAAELADSGTSRFGAVLRQQMESCRVRNGQISRDIESLYQQALTQE